MTTVVTELVGARFRPPAKYLIMGLTWDQTLVLVPEPENPYDPKALKVLIELEDLGLVERESVDAALEGTGHTVESLCNGDEGPLFHLGYVADSDGKVCKNSGNPGNREVEVLRACAHCKVTLAFSPEGKPQVVVTTED